MYLRTLLAISLIGSALSALGADSIADAFGVSFGSSIDGVIDASTLEVKDEGKGICRYILNGAKILNQKSYASLEISDLLTKTGEKTIEGFIVSSKGVLSGRLEGFRSAVLKRFPTLLAFRGDNGKTYYTYENDAHEKRVVYFECWGRRSDCHFSMTVFTLNLSSSVGRTSMNLEHLSRACVTITTDSGMTGSGVLVEEGGDLYLFTNRHVIEGGCEVSAKLQSGEAVALGNLQVSKSLDLARFKVKSSGQGLKMEVGAPKIGETIVVLGNSLGAGAITQTEGRVLGVGADIIEVDAGFVKGNSGGPIVNLKGNLVGIATFLLKASDEVDWKIRGTRFENARRFGLRPCVNDWSNVSLNLLNKQHKSFCNVVMATALLMVSDFVLGDEYPMKKIEVDFGRINKIEVDLSVLRKYKNLVGCYNALQQRLAERNNLEQQVVRYLRGYGDIEIPCRVSKHGSKTSVLYRIDDGFTNVVEKFCNARNMNNGESFKDRLKELKKAQTALLQTHDEYRDAMDEHVAELRAKLSKPYEVQVYNEESKMQMEQLDRFLEFARDNKYK